VRHHEAVFRINRDAVGRDRLQTGDDGVAGVGARPPIEEEHAGVCAHHITSMLTDDPTR
jgi:hypothetical protein